MTTGTGAIVVPLDGSKNAEKAGPMAALLARLYGAPVRFVHVVDETEGVFSAADLERARGLFASYAAELGARLGLPATGVSAETGLGPAAATILGMAGDARFIVIASHGRGGFRATVIGSVADKVVRGAKTPVVVVPAVEDAPRPDEQRLVLIAVDGSPEAERGLAAGRDLAAKLNASVALVRAVSVPPPVGVEFAYYPPDVLGTMSRAADEYMESIRRPAEKVMVVRAEASVAIEQAAAEIGAGLVVMTSQGKGLAARLALGSATDRVMHSLRRVLLVVPGGNGKAG